jgi:hypothetical protein
MVILAALNGGFNSLAGSKENQVLDIVNKKIQTDIDLQREQIATGRTRANNQIQRLVDEGYSLRDAENVAKSKMEAYTAKFWEDQAKVNGSAEFKEQAMLNAATLKAQSEARVREIAASGEDRVQSQNGYTDTVKRAVPKPASVKPDDIYKAGQIRQQQLEDLDAAEVAKAIGTVGDDGKPRNLSVKRAKEVVDGSKELATKLPRFEVAENRIRQGLEAMGVPMDAYDPENGTIDWSKAKDLKGVGPIDSRPLLKEGPIGAAADAVGLTQSERKAVEDSLIGIQEDLTYATTGASATKDQQETFKTQSGQNMSSEDAVKENLSRTAQTLATQKNAMFSGDKDATKLYRHILNRGETASLRPGVN